ncbi:MAG: helix-turn-helix domain-containing protein, partial [Nitrospira sp.]
RGWMTLEELEREHIIRVLKHHHWDLGRSSSILGIHRKTLLRKLRHYGLVNGPRTGYPGLDALSAQSEDERSPIEETPCEASAYTA